MSTLPPDLAVGALYDRLLQSALRQFFERATLETEPAPSAAPDVRLIVEPSPDPTVLSIRCFGTRYTLRVPRRWPFTSNEVRFARAIGSVLTVRYRAILSPQMVADRGELFSGAIEDRYVGAFLDEHIYSIRAPISRADRIATVIEVLRVAALSSYENRTISTGVLLLGTTEDPLRPHVRARASAPPYTHSLIAIKSFYRLADGDRTVFLADADARLLDLVDIGRWAGQFDRQTRLSVPCAKAYEAHARATLHQGHVCGVLTRSREIKIFAEGAEIFTFRGATWHLLDLKAKYELWAEAVGEPALASRLFQTALDLADERQGALFVVVGDSAAVSELVAAGDRLDVDAPDRASAAVAPSRRDLLHLLEGRSATDLDPSVFAALASLDGATVVDRAGRLLAAGAILRHPATDDLQPVGVIEGARTTAAVAASRFGPVLKVSEDGVITFFDRVRVWDI